MGIRGRFINIAGSTAKDADAQLVKRCHAVVRELTRALLKEGAGLVTTVGPDERIDPESADTACVFYWTILEEVDAFRRDSGLVGGTPRDPLVKAVCSRKAVENIPDHRRELWTRLLETGALVVQKLTARWSAGAYVRQQQARVGDAAVLLGGGQGVEHLAALFAERGRTVIPIDAKIGAFSDDGHGAPALFEAAFSYPERFVLDPKSAQSLPTLLHGISFTQSRAEPAVMAQKLVALLEKVISPRVFYIRLLNESVPEYGIVESFFTDVVTPSVRELGFTEDQIGLKVSTEAFIDREIFERLHYADVVIADITSLRPNTFLELGYALGRPLPTLITARKETPLPFDMNAMPVHFWNPGSPNSERKRLFLEHWQRCVDRPPLVRPRELA
jgi:hypothetical protein